MKNSSFIAQASISVCIFLCVVVTSSSAQSYYYWSFHLGNASSFCPMPAQVNAKIFGFLLVGSNPCPDSGVVLFEWQYGKYDTAIVHFSGNNCYFNEIVPHIYETPGEYQARATFLYPVEADNENQSPNFRISPDCVKIKGVGFNDVNNDCSLDTSENGVTRQNLVFYDSNETIIGAGFTDSTGFYRAYVTSGMEQCRVKRSGGSNYISCNSTELSFSTLNDTNLNIPLKCNTVFDVASVHGTSIVGNPGESGFATFRVNANTCTSNTAHVILELDDELHWTGMIEGPEPDSSNGNRFYWNLQFDEEGVLGIGQRVLFSRFNFITDTSAAIGDRVNFKVFVFSDPTEVDLTNNNHIWDLEIGGPYDPNNKLVTPQGNGPSGKVAPETEFTYTVNFQNTGNDTAINVFVIDTLSEHLDLESIEILDSKRPMTVAYYNDRVLRFDFKNIQLPDSGASQEGSKGWFVFSVKAKENLALGTEIRNYVDIYFDYNAPIRTNSTINTIDQGITHPKLDLIAQNNLCVNSDIGSISTQVTGGTEPYNFLWNPNLEGASNDSLTSGIYSVTVIDSNLYMDYNTIEIVDNRTITANPGQISGNYEVTSGDYHSYEVVENPSSSFDWTVAGGTIAQDNGHRVKVLWADTMAGTIKVVQTDSNGCIGSTEQSIVVYPLSISEAGASSFSIYPNPTDGIIEIQLKELSGSDRIEIIDILGRVVYTKNLNNTSTQIDLSALASGTYTVRMIGDNVSEERTMVKR